VFRRRGLGCGGEVARKRAAGFGGDDRAVLLPNLLEQRGEELAPLGGVVLGLPEPREVLDQRLSAVEVGVGVTLEDAYAASAVDVSDAGGVVVGGGDRVDAVGATGDRVDVVRVPERDQPRGGLLQFDPSEFFETHSMSTAELAKAALLLSASSS
jgi:hypothetical protein